MTIPAKKVWIPSLVIATVLSLFGYYLHLRDNYDLCESARPEMVEGPSGARVQMDTRFCSPLAGDPGTIVIRYRRSPADSAKIVFAYNPSYPAPDESDAMWYPTIRWNGPSRLTITIDRISQIQRQFFTKHDAVFDYEIGRVDYP